MVTFRAGDARQEGCIVRQKTRCIRVPRGVTATVEWEMRDESGDAVPLTDYWPEASESESGSPLVLAEIQVRFVPVEERNMALLPTQEGVVVDSSRGIVKFAVPYELTRRSGVYRFSIGIVTENNEVERIDNGLIVVEPSLWGDREQDSGMPSIQEVRDYLRDTAVENDLLRDVEFDDAEIALALIACLREWNESPPLIVRHTCDSFPYREMWLKGVFAHLYQTAAMWYHRNDLQATHGGLTIQDRNKHREYEARAVRYLQEWRSAMLAKKVEINAYRCYGQI